MMALVTRFVQCDLMTEDEAIEHAGQWTGNCAVCFMGDKAVLAYYSSDESQWYTVDGKPVETGSKKYKLIG